MQKTPSPALGKYQAPEIHAALKKLTVPGKYNRSSVLMKGLQQQGLWPATECLNLPDRGYPDGAMTQAAKVKLKKLAKEQAPFFMMLGYRKPHLPFNAPKKYWDLYEREAFEIHPHQQRHEDRPAYAYHTYGELGAYTGFEAGKPVAKEDQRRLIHGYHACISYVDAQIGKVIAQLKATGLYENTVIVLWGDHGWHLGDHGIWCKHSNFEQATHAPLIICAPGMKKGLQIQSPSEFIDIFPTVCELVDIETPNEVDGLSLVPILNGKQAEVKPYAVSQYPRYATNGYTLRAGDYRLTWWMPKDFISYQPVNKKSVKAVELYDYARDPEGNPEPGPKPRIPAGTRNHVGTYARLFCLG